MQITLEQINEHLERPLSKEDVEQAFSLHAFEIDYIWEENGHVIFDVDVLPNRSSDCLSVLGLARELSAILDIKMKKDFLKEDFDTLYKKLKEKENETVLTVERKDKEYASAYLSAYIEGVKLKESPQWLKDFLASHGQKSINNLVDATNYVLFYLGQPTHIFDADKLQKNQDGTLVLSVRAAREEESFETLDKQHLVLDPSVRVIEDATSEKALAIAGIKGGKDSGVSEQTVNIVLESARFDPTLTRKASQKLALRTDASKRFENDLPEKLPVFGLQLLIDTVLELAGGELRAVALSHESFKENEKVAFSLEKINKLIGVEVNKGEFENILKRLDFQLDDESAVAPFWRTDIKIWQDLAEELARLYGLSKIRSKSIPKSLKEQRVLKSYCISEFLRKTLLNEGFVEISTSTLQDKGELELENALASDKNFFRDSLSYSMQKVLDKNEKNAPLFGIYDAIKLFEIGTVYKGGKEFLSLVVAVRPLAKKKREEKAEKILQEIKAKLEAQFSVALSDPEGELWEMPLESFDAFECKDYPELPVLHALQYKPFSQFPFVLRDIAVWLPESEPKESLETLIKQHGSELLRRADLFDEYRKDGRVSYAYHLVFQAQDRTLTDDEVGAIMENIEKEITIKGWEIR